MHYISISTKTTPNHFLLLLFCCKLHKRDENIPNVSTKLTGINFILQLSHKTQAAADGLKHIVY